MTTLPLKKGDRLPVIDVQLIGANGAAVNLTGATVTFTMASEDGRVISNRAPATVTAATTGNVRYSWDADDTLQIGTFLCEWVATFAGGLEMTFPNRGYDKIEVTNRLA